MEKILEIERGAEGEIIVRFRPPRSLPPLVDEHFRAAGREFLLGLRGLLETAAKKSPKSRRGPTKIDVQ